MKTLSLDTFTLFISEIKKHIEKYGFHLNPQDHHYYKWNCCITNIIFECQFKNFNWADNLIDRQGRHHFNNYCMGYKIDRYIELKYVMWLKTCINDPIIEKCIKLKAFL